MKKKFRKNALSLNVFRQKRYVDSLILSLLTLSVYVSTLMPGVGGFGDTGIFQFVGKVLGVPHTTGYPAYTLLTHIFSYFPFGSEAFKANLFSAICATAGVVFLHRILLRFSERPFVSFAVAATFAFTYTLWSQAVIAEVYALNILFYASTLYFFIRWYEEDNRTLFFLACYVYAMSFGNHLTMITLLPALIYLVWVRHSDYYFSIPIVLSVAFFILLGFSQYFYLIARYYNLNTPYLEISVPNFSRLFYELSGGHFRESYTTTTFRWMMFIQLPILLRFIWNEYSLLVLVAALGFVRFRNLHLAVFLLLAGAGTFGFALIYQIRDIYIYLIPLYLVISIFIAHGFETILDWLSVEKKRWLQSALLFLPLWFLFYNYNKANERDDVRDGEFVHAALQHIPPKSILLCPDFTYATYIWYFLYTERPKEDSVYLFYTFTELPLYEIKNYVQGKSSLYLPLQRKFVPTGFQLYLLQAYRPWEWVDEFKRVPYRDQADYTSTFFNRIYSYLNENGFYITRIADSLYAVTFLKKE